MFFEIFYSPKKTNLEKKFKVEISKQKKDSRYEQ